MNLQSVHVSSSPPALSSLQTICGCEELKGFNDPWWGASGMGFTRGYEDDFDASRPCQLDESIDWAGLNIASVVPDGRLEIHPGSKPLFRPRRVGTGGEGVSAFCHKARFGVAIFMCSRARQKKLFYRPAGLVSTQAREGAWNPWVTTNRTLCC